MRALLRGEPKQTKTTKRLVLQIFHQFTALSLEYLTEEVLYQIGIRLRDFPQWRPKCHIVNCKKNMRVMKLGFVLGNN